MKRYKIDKTNKYSGIVNIDNIKEVAKGYYFYGKIVVFSVAMALMLSLPNAIKRTDDVNYLSSNMSYDGEEIFVNILNYRSKYKACQKNIII